METDVNLRPGAELDPSPPSFTRFDLPSCRPSFPDFTLTRTTPQALLGSMGINTQAPGGAEDPAPPPAAAAEPAEMEVEQPPAPLTPEEQQAADIKAVRDQGNAHYKAKEFR